MADGDRWVVSPVGAGRIIELDGETVCMATDQRHARYLVSVANAWERSAGAPAKGRDKYPSGAVTEDRCPVCHETMFHVLGCANGTPRPVAGDRLDAERRGDCSSCMHSCHWWRQCQCGCTDYTEA